MLVNSQTKSNNTLFPLASCEFPAGWLHRVNLMHSSILLYLLGYISRVCLIFEKVVFIHHVLPYLGILSKDQNNFCFLFSDLKQRRSKWLLWHGELYLDFNEFFILE